MRNYDLAVASVLLACMTFAMQSSAPAGAAGLLEEGRLAYANSQYARAVDLLQSAAQQDPQNAEIYFLLTKSHFEMDHFDLAIQSAERAVAISPRNSVYHEWLGRAFGEKANHASIFSAMSLARKTHKEFEIAVQLDERNFSAQQALVEFYCSAPGIVGGGDDKAVRQIARLEALDVSEYHYARGNCRRQKKDFASADAEFTLALDSDPRSPDLVFDIGDYALKTSQPERLLAVAEAGNKVAPADPRADFYRAAAYILRRERFAEARDILHGYLGHAPVRTGYPKPALVHEWLGRSFEAQGDTASARQEYQSALQADPKSRAAHEALKRLDKK
jgi:tetratricopeptide (TPR) repeat protein